MDVASAGMAISTVDNAVMVAASTCTCFFSELARTTTGRLTRVAARLAFMETLFPWKVLRAGLAMARFMVHAVAAMAMCVRARVESVSLVRRGAMKHDAARS